jgi:hypothetical protein
MIMTFAQKILWRGSFIQSWEGCCLKRRPRKLQDSCKRISLRSNTLLVGSLECLLSFNCLKLSSGFFSLKKKNFINFRCSFVRVSCVGGSCPDSGRMYSLCLWGLVCHFVLNSCVWNETLDTLVSRARLKVPAEKFGFLWLHWSPLG